MGTATSVGACCGEGHWGREGSEHRAGGAHIPSATFPICLLPFAIPQHVSGPLCLTADPSLLTPHCCPSCVPVPLLPPWLPSLQAAHCHPVPRSAHPLSLHVFCGPSWGSVPGSCEELLSQEVRVVPPCSAKGFVPGAPSWNNVTEDDIRARW